jgi:hypothetical protein
MSMAMFQEMERLNAENEALKQNEAARVNTCNDLEKQLRQLQLEKDCNARQRRLQEKEGKEEEEQVSIVPIPAPHQQEPTPSVKQHPAAIFIKQNDTSIHITKEKRIRMCANQHENDKQHQCRSRNNKFKASEARLKSEIQERERKCMNLGRVLRRPHPAKLQEEIATISGPGTDEAESEALLKSEIQECERKCMHLVRVLARQQPQQQEECCGQGTVVVDPQKKEEQRIGQDYRHAASLMAEQDTRRPGPEERFTLPSRAAVITAQHSGCEVLDKRSDACANNNKSSSVLGIIGSRKAVCKNLEALKNKTIESPSRSLVPFFRIRSLREKQTKSFAADLARRETANANNIVNKDQQDLFNGIGDESSILVSKPMQIVAVTRQPPAGHTGSKSKDDGSSMKASALHRRKARYADQQFLDLQGAGMLPLPGSTGG